VARHLARAVIDAEVLICSQRIPGVWNDIADLLTFELGARGKGHDDELTLDGPDNDTLTEQILTHMSQLVPEHFRISQLPTEIDSFALTAPQILSESWSRKSKNLTPTKKGHGTDGSVFSNEWRSETTSSLCYQQTSKGLLLLPSSSITAPPNMTLWAALLQGVRNPWLN